MIPPTPSLTVPPAASAEQLLRLGKPFVEFPRFSILQVRQERDLEDKPVSFSEWLQQRLQAGLPFVLSDFEKLPEWPQGDPANGTQPTFGIERLIELSTKKNIPIRNCSTGRDLSFTLRKFADSARHSYQEFQNLYARDLPCPVEWLDQCKKLLPTEVQWSGRLDLFKWLPPCARSEVMMAYVGSEGSSSGFHRCFSSTVALNFLVETGDKPVVCIGTDFDSQKKYDTFMSAKGVSPHLDWHNLGSEDLLQADFPIYAYNQKIGDLVVFPPATAHQIWNPSTLTTKMVWNILHPLSLEVGFRTVQPSFNKLCHPDLARVNLSLASAMMSLINGNADDPTPFALPPDLPLLSRLFRQMIHDETIDADPPPPIQQITLSPNVIATCNFCSTAIWNRHVRCTQCADFDLCLLCYLNGRSCEHVHAYQWAEIVSPEECNRVLNRSREILGFQPEEAPEVDTLKTLGTAVNDLMRAKASQVSRLCHLCRIDHPEWKGKRCEKCTAFFCYRGLYRHFDFGPGDVLRHIGNWSCPKCQEICNCRCCHFSTAYMKSEKPASKRRVKAADSRGKNMGFADNVFDQKRGRRESHHSQDSATLPVVSQVAGKKRPLAASTSIAPHTPMRKLELLTPDPSDLSALRHNRTESEYSMDSSLFERGITRPSILPSVKSLAGDCSYYISPPEERGLRISSSPASSNMPPPHNTLPPLLGHSGVGNSTNVPYSSASTSGFVNGTVYAQNSSAVHNPHHSSYALPSTQPQQPPQYQPGASAFSLLNSSYSKGSTHHLPGPSHDPDTKSPTLALDAEIISLETRIASLKRYEQEFIALGLNESQESWRRELTALEEKASEKKREKGRLLMERLRREGFGGLADVVGKEVGVGGLGIAGVPVANTALGHENGTRFSSFSGSGSASAPGLGGEQNLT